MFHETIVDLLIKLFPKLISTTFLNVGKRKYKKKILFSCIKHIYVYVMFMFLFSVMIIELVIAVLVELVVAVVEIIVVLLAVRTTSTTSNLVNFLSHTISFK